MAYPYATHTAPTGAAILHGHRADLARALAHMGRPLATEPESRHADALKARAAATRRACLPGASRRTIDAEAYCEAHGLPVACPRIEHGGPAIYSRAALPA